MPTRTTTTIAKTDSRVAAITEQRFMQVVSHNPHFALDMMRLLTERVRRNRAS